ELIALLFGVGQRRGEALDRRFDFASPPDDSYCVNGSEKDVRRRSAVARCESNVDGIYDERRRLRRASGGPHSRRRERAPFRKTSGSLGRLDLERNTSCGKRDVVRNGS